MENEKVEIPKENEKEENENNEVREIEEQDLKVELLEIS